MNTYRQAGAARVYWLTLPAPRDPGRQRISRAVNAAIAVAAEPYRAQVRVLDMAAVFTPGGRYRDAMDVGGRRRDRARARRHPPQRRGREPSRSARCWRALRADYGPKVPG